MTEAESVSFFVQIYPYLVVNDHYMTESRREERVLQLLRMLNHFLTKQKVRVKELQHRLISFIPTIPDSGHTTGHVGLFSLLVILVSS